MDERALIDNADIGDLEQVRRLLEMGVNVDITFTETSYTPLYYASHGGFPSVARTLLEHGAQVNFCNDNGSTCIHAATIRDHSSIVQMLLEWGANVNSRNETGYVPLSIVGRNLDSLGKLLSWGASVNPEPDIKGRTPLYEAILCRAISVSRTLLAWGTKIEEGESVTRTIYRHTVD